MLTDVRAEYLDVEKKIADEEVSDWELSTSEDIDSEDNDKADISGPSTLGNAASLVHSSRNQATGSLNVLDTLGIRETAKKDTKSGVINFGVKGRKKQAAQNVQTKLLVLLSGEKKWKILV